MYYLRHIFIPFLCFYLVGCTNYTDELNQVEQRMDTAPDSALHVLKKINPQRLYTPSNKALYALLMSQALDKNDIKVESDSLIHIATDYYTEHDAQRAAYSWFYCARVAFNGGNAKTQADALLKAQEYAELTKNNKLLGLVYSDKGLMYKAQGQTDSAICYLKKSYAVFDKVNDNYNSILCLLNTGYLYLYISKIDSALKYCNIAYKLAKHNKDKISISNIQRGIGIVYLQQNNYVSAIKHYHLAPYTQIPIYDNNKLYLLASAYLRSNNLDSTLYYLKKVNDFNEIGTDYYLLWQTFYEKKGNITKALFYAKRVTAVTDSLYKTKLDVSFAGLETKYKYQGLQLSNQRLIIKNKQSDTVLLIVLLILSTLTLIGLFWRIRVKKQQLEAQKKLVLQEHNLLQQQIENNALLEKQLKIKAILLMNIEKHRRDAIKNSKLWKVSSQESNLGHKDTFYQELIATMDLEYNNISSRLLNKFPTLSLRDIQVCCLLLANFDTGMIAIILDLKIESMNTYRYRLRTKFGLTNPDNLIDYLRNF